MAGYNFDLYEDNDMIVTEEEFVFDSVHNVNIAKIMNNSS